MAKKQRNARASSVRVSAPPVVSSRAAFSDRWLFLALAVVTFAVYAQVGGHQFISLDDDFYISENPMVKGGLTLSGLGWAFTTFHAANWHPLTWIAHMLDSQLFGLWAGGHLLVNTLVHLANVLLVFQLLRLTTGARWRSALVAALFALHPLHVESVAWAAERKDTLAACFGLLSLLAYVRYVAAPSAGRSLLTALALALGLMAKPMLVTWPFVMLLLDFWPLRRFRALADLWPRLREKLPLFALVAASMIITVIAQKSGGAVRDLVEAPLWFRLSNALVSYVRYLALTFWPHDLAVYYPFAPSTVTPGKTLGAALLLMAITALALVQIKARPYLLIGWLWFLGTLVPVIGLVQVGGQVMADRYHYLPSIGLFLALVFGAASLCEKWKLPTAAQAALAGLPILAAIPLTVLQIQRWRDSETLFTHTLRVTPPNLIIEHNYGLVLGHAGRFEEAAQHFTRALAIKPDFFDALLNLGITRSQQHRSEEAVPFFQRALQSDPGSAKAHQQLGLAYANLQQDSAATAELERAAQLDPRDPDTRANLGLILMRQRKIPEATAQLEEALRLNPNHAEAHNNLGLLLLATGQARASIPHFEAALRVRPDLAVARQNLERARAQASGR